MRDSERDAEFSDFVQRPAHRAGADGPPAHGRRRALAEDLVQTSLTRLYVAWPRVRRAGNPVGYARTTLTHSFVDERRRGHRRHETVTEAPADRADGRHRPGRRSRRPGRAARPRPAPARGRRAPALARPRRRRDRPAARLLHRDREVPERQGPGPPALEPRTHHHPGGARMNDLATLLDRASGTTPDTVRRHSRPHPWPPRTGPHPSPSRRCRAGRCGCRRCAGRRCPAPGRRRAPGSRRRPAGRAGHRHPAPAQRGRDRRPLHVHPYTVRLERPGPPPAGGRLQQGRRQLPGRSRRLRRQDRAPARPTRPVGCRRGPQRPVLPGPRRRGHPDRRDHDPAG